MKKYSQNIIDLISLLGPVDIFTPSINNKEAQALYDLWQCDTDTRGLYVVKPELDAVVLSTLQSKGMVETPKTVIALHHAPCLSITDKGQEVIRNIILYNENSAFEPQPEKIDYANIYRKMKFGPGIKEAKTASKVVSASQNWLEKITCK